MWKVPLKEACPRRRTGSCRYVAASKADSFTHQPVQIGCLHIVKTQFSNRIEALLIGNDKDDIWAFLRHGATTGEKGVFNYDMLKTP